MKKILLALIAAVSLSTAALADNVLVVDPQYGGVATNVVNRLQAAGHTTTITTTAPTDLTGYQQVWDLRYASALTSSETTLYTNFVTNGGFAYFVTENPGCCMARNNSVAALITGLGGGSTQIGPGWAGNVNSNMNTTYMTNGITVNYAAVAAIVNSQGIPLISDSNGNVSGMSWIGRAGALSSGVTGTIVTVADINWIDSTRMVINGTVAQQQNVQALDDIIGGIVAGTVAGTISSTGNGAGATNGNSGSSTPTVVSTAAGPSTFTSTSTFGTAVVTTTHSYGRADSGQTATVTKTTTVTTTTPVTTTTTTTPSTVTTYSDGSTVTTQGTPTTSTSTADQVVTTSSSQSESSSFAAINDSIKITRNNPFLIDTLSPRESNWASPRYSWYNTSAGSYSYGGISFGKQWIVDENTYGFAFDVGQLNSNGYLNNNGDNRSYSGVAYILSKQDYVWLNLSAGFNYSEHSSTVRFPAFGLYGNTSAKQKTFYADVRGYASETLYGIRPFAGVTFVNSTVDSIRYSGDSLAYANVDKGTSSFGIPYVGLRYEINKEATVEYKLSNTKDYRVVHGVRATYSKKVTDDVDLNFIIGYDRGHKYENAYGMVGLTWNF